MPYATTRSGISVTTAFAASFMRSKALLSFGFSHEYLLANLELVSLRMTPHHMYVSANWLAGLLGEPTAVYPDHNPCVRQQLVRLLELLDILPSMRR